MTKRLLICAFVLLVVASLSLGASDKGQKGSWTGWVTDTQCGAKGANEKHADCAKKCVDTKGAKYALYNPDDKKVYILDPQDKAAAHAGHHVTVEGTVDGDTIKVSSIKLADDKGGKPKS